MTQNGWISFAELGPSYWWEHRHSPMGRKLFFQYKKEWAENHFLEELFKNSQRQKCNLAFFDGGECHGILMAQVDPETGLCDFWGHPLKLTWSNSISFDMQKRAVSTLGGLLREKKVRRLNFWHDPVLLDEFFSGYEQTKVDIRAGVNLLRSEEAIHAGIRKSFKSLVNWGRRELKVQFFDHETITDEHLQKFEDFHIETAGRRTRTHESWMRQLEIIKSQQGFMCLAYLSERLVSAIMVFHGSETAFYGTSVNDRALMLDSKPINHWPLLASILECKRRGLKQFDLGSMNEQENDPKFNSIVKFKRGFSDHLTCEPYHFVGVRE